MPLPRAGFPARQPPQDWRRGGAHEVAAGRVGGKCGTGRGRGGGGGSEGTAGRR